MKQTGLDKAIAQLEDDIRVREAALAILKGQRALLRTKPRVRLVKKDAEEKQA